MDELEVLVAERACDRLAAQYAHAIDLGHAERVADLFTDDGVWESAERKLEGGDSIRAAFAGRAGMDRTSRHVCTTSVITVDGPGDATGITYFTLYRHDGPADGPAPLDGPSIVGHYEDRFVLTGAGWRFAHRKAVAAFVARSSGQ